VGHVLVPTYFQKYNKLARVWVWSTVCGEVCVVVVGMVERVQSSGCGHVLLRECETRRVT
jgi:hypothetical protein